MSLISLEQFSLVGRVALVTGAGRGLGFEIAKALALAGAHVIVNGRSAATLEQRLETITAAGGTGSAAAFDVTDEAAATRAIRNIADRHGRLDILVNNVGMRDRRGLFEFQTSEVRRLLETNLLAPFHLARETARLMIERHYGRIINITSVTAFAASAGDTPYVTAKGGLASLTRALAAELGPEGITVNAIAPGGFATEANAQLAADPQSSLRLAKRTSLGRWGRPEEIAGAAVFLAAAASSFVTGHILAVDGGLLGHG
jgi:gluconate 5-dehydrogenase